MKTIAIAVAAQALTDGGLAVRGASLGAVIAGAGGLVASTPRSPQ